MVKSDLVRIDNMHDEEIDYSDIPALTEEELAAMKPLQAIFPELVMDEQLSSQQEIVISVDEEVLEYFKTEASTHQTSYLALINSVLKSYVLAHDIRYTFSEA